MHQRGPWLALGLMLAGAPALGAEEGDQGDFNVYVKGGVGNFVGSAGEGTQAGPVYGAIVNVQPTNVLGLEIGYAGSRHGLEGASGSLLRNGGTAMLKVGLPFVEKVRPFAGVGLSAQWVAVQGAAGGYGADFMQEVPVAAGLEFNAGAFHAGLRGTYNFLVDAAFADGAAPDGETSGAMIEGAFTLGGRF
jgi:opacity protein-like surface antigen